MFFYGHKALPRYVKSVITVVALIFLVAGCSKVTNSIHKTLHPQEEKQESLKEKRTKQKAKEAFDKQLDSDRQSQAFDGYAAYINNIDFTGQNGVNIYVNSDFQDLPELQRDNVIHAAQNMASNQLYAVKIFNDDDLKGGVFATIYLGPNSIGQSSMGDYGKIKWND